MASRGGQVQEEAWFHILRLLDENPDLSQRDLARKAGVSVGAVNYLLRALVEKGLVKIGNFTASDDKRRYAYVLTPQGITAKAALTRRFLRRKIAEYEALKAEIEGLKAEIDGNSKGRSG